MPVPGQKFTLRLTRGNTIPAWPTENVARRWDSEEVLNGAEGVMVGSLPWMDEPDLDSTWWLARFGNLWAPVEIHDHAGMES